MARSHFSATPLGSATDCKLCKLRPCRRHFPVQFPAVIEFLVSPPFVGEKAWSCPQAAGNVMRTSAPPSGERAKVMSFTIVVLLLLMTTGAAMMTFSLLWISSLPLGWY